MQVRQRFGFSIFLLASLIFPAHADDTILFNIVNLQVSAEREIPNDEMVVLLATEYEGSDAVDLAAKVNSDMRWALEMIKKYSSVDAQTKNYQTYPAYRKQVLIGWHTSQQVMLKSKDISALSELVGKLQKRLHVEQMNFDPSKETRVNYENELIGEVMQAFLTRVNIVKEHMPAKNHRIIELNIDTDGYHPPEMYARGTMTDSMEMIGDPAFEAGTSTLNVIVSGAVQFF